MMMNGCGIYSSKVIHVHAYCLGIAAAVTCMCVCMCVCVSVVTRFCSLMFFFHSMSTRSFLSTLIRRVSCLSNISVCLLHISVSVSLALTNVDVG